jgi:hypothetical protein
MPIRIGLFVRAVIVSPFRIAAAIVDERPRQT